MSDDIELPTVEMAQAISQHLGEEISSDQVHQVLHALNAVKAGEPVGTVRRNPDTGHVAHRCLVNGMGQWRVSGTDGDLYGDLQPALPDWELICGPMEKKPEPSDEYVFTHLPQVPTIEGEIVDG